MIPLAGLLVQPAMPTWGALHLGAGFPGMGNATLSVTALHPLELELGSEGSLGHNGFTARAGPALRLGERRRDGGAGRSSHLPLLVGYRTMSFGRGQAAHCLTVNPTLTLDAWVARHLGFELQLTAGASFTMSDPSGGVGVPVVPDVQLRVGLAL